MFSIKYSILITTKNRLEDLTYTLGTLHKVLDRKDVELLVYDDASTDGTDDYIVTHYPTIKFFRNDVSKGLIYNRTVLLNACQGQYAISLDDDAHFLTTDYLTKIEQFFEAYPTCALQGFSIYWSKEDAGHFTIQGSAERVKSFVGCGHVWRIEAWRDIPSYPDWFVFYGEEDFASYQLFLKGWEVWYNPEIIVQHRVDMNNRKQDKDYVQRQRRSLRAGWFLYLMFYPYRIFPRKIMYSIYDQVRRKTLKGNWMATKALLLALFDVFYFSPKIVKHSNRLTIRQLEGYQKLSETKIYWNPK